MSDPLIQKIEGHLRGHDWETARRLCLHALDGGGGELADGVHFRLSVLLHEAYHHLADIPSLRETLDRIKPTNDDQRFEAALLQAADAERLATAQYRYYDVSPEAKAGLSYDEYLGRWRQRASELWRTADSLANTEARRIQLAETRRALAPIPGLERTRATVVECIPQLAVFGSLSGSLKFPDGRAVTDSIVTLGLRMEVQKFDPTNFVLDGCGVAMSMSAQQTLTARTDARGAFSFPEVPAGLHEFLAVTLDPAEFDIATRFVAQGILISEGSLTELNLIVEDWASAPPREAASPFTRRLDRAGAHHRLAHEQKLHNPFHYSFPRQEVRFPLPRGVTPNPARLLLLSSAAPDIPQPFQLIGLDLVFFTDLPEVTDRVFALYIAENGNSEPFANTHDLAPVLHADGSAVIDTGRASFRIPPGEGRDALPPLLGVRGEDNVWRGKGRFKLPPGTEILFRKTEFTVAGPLVIEWTTRYRLSSGHDYELRFTAHRGEPYLLVHELSPELEGAAFEFSLSEFIGGRGFLHWNAERDTQHWSTLDAEDRELARLQESVPWWLPPAGFAYGMSPDGIAQKDFIAVFTIRRGEWVDRKFEKICQGPIGPDGKSNRELDWPFPEMVGSTISMINAQSTADGDAFFTFNLFDGERHWGLLVSSWDRNDGGRKELASVQHKVSSPRLQHFKDWHLDEQDTVSRPCVVAHRKALRRIRKKRDVPGFCEMWQRIKIRKTWESDESLAFAVEGDPVIAWRKKKELVTVAPLRARVVLLGRDVSDFYSPVGGRMITAFVEEYDLIAASGVFTPEEERTLRAYFILMAHMFMETDLMNWRYNSRNANFESDRVEIIGTIGLAFRGHPDSGKFISHAVSLMEKALEVYCTPGSGKWYENPPAYYLQSLKCRTNLLFHLAREGIFEPTRMERLKDFLRWGILLLTPPFPHDYNANRDGCARDQYPAIEKVRRIPPIGDHARLGAWVAGQYALMSKLYRPHDPAFADLLLWAWQSGGSDGGFFASSALLFAALDEDDLRPAPAQQLQSRRLEGFGAVFRGSFNTENEFYLLLKQGPGGYRYHRTEGGVILFADGKPILFDGGEAGEAWRHTTLSFYDTHMPLAAGHVERFHTFPGIDFCQGVHPLAIEPGAPDLLSNSCKHTLVPVAWQRFAEPNPADVRSVAWIKDEYIVLHDDLHLDPAIPSHWHAQVVADNHTGNAREGLLFKGRFGTDLQIVLPNQHFAAETCVRTPMYEYHIPPDKSVAMLHLQLTGDNPAQYLAVLRPLSEGKQPIHARLIPGGVKVEGTDIDDAIFLNRSPVSINAEGIRFEGRYASVVNRGPETQLALIDGTLLEAAGIRLRASGVAAFLTSTPASTNITAEGIGHLEVTRDGKTTLFEISGRVAAAIS